MTKLLLNKANLQVLLIERKKMIFFLFLNNMKSHQSTVLWSGHKKVGPVWGPSWSHSSQSFSRIAVVQGIVITAQKVSSFLHKISQFYTSPHHGIYLLFCFVSFLIYLRSSVKLEFLKASQHQNSTRFVEVSIFFSDIYSHTLSLSCLFVCVRNSAKEKDKARYQQRKLEKTTSRVLSMVRVRDSNSQHICFKSIHHN